MDQAMETTRLRQYIEHDSSALLGMLRYYLYRAGLSGRDLPLEAAARDLLNEVVAEALAHESRFQTAADPRAWLLGIAANLVKRRQSELVGREQREPLIRDLHPDLEAAMSDDELFDWIAEVAAAPPDMLETHQDVTALLAAISPDDARVLRLAIMNGLDGAALAAALGVSPGAARVRLHRALNRLRQVVQQQKDNEDG